MATVGKARGGVAISGGPAGALEQQPPLGLVARQRRGALELGARLVGAAEPGEQVAAHRRQQVVAGERRLVAQGIDDREAGLRVPAAMPTATARFSSTTGDGATSASTA